MSIKLGNSNITLKVGSSAVTAAYLGSTLVYSGGTPPTFQGKYLATFSDGHTESAVCDASSAISAFYGDLVSLQIGDCVTGTSEWLCNHQTGLTSVDLGNSLMSIANGSFNNCSSLTSIEIPSSVTSIGEFAFQECSGLTELTIPSGVTSIGKLAFYGCNSLSVITFESKYPSTLGENAIDGNSEVTISVPCESVKAYKSAWTDLSNKIQCDSPTPTTYTYSITIQGLENGDTTNIRWKHGDHIDSNVGNGTYTYTTTEDLIPVDIDSVTDYSLDYRHLDLHSGGSQTVTFTHQGGGGGGLVQIPVRTDMSQYYGQSIKRLVIGDTTTIANTAIACEYFDDFIHNDYLSINQWVVNGQGQFSSINSLPIDITLTTPETLTKWTSYAQDLSETQNPFNDLQIEWA